MYQQRELNEFMQRYERKQWWVRRSSQALMVLALVVAAMLGAVTFGSLFHVSIVLMAVVFAAGIIVDLQINLEKLPKLMELVLIRHLFMGLEVESISHHQMKQVKTKHKKCSKAELAQHQEQVKAWLNQWVTLRRQFYRDNKKAGSRAFFDKLQASTEVEGHQAFIAFATECEEALLQKRAGDQSSLRLKKGLTVVGLPLSMTAGLGMASIGYASFMNLLGILGVSVATLPVLWIGLGVAVAVIAGAFWTATMYKTFYSAVKSNLFKSLYKQLKFDTSAFEAAERTDKIKMVAAATAKYITVAALSVLGIVAVVASCGAYGSAILQVCSFIPSIAVFAMGFAMLPVRALFALKHAVGAVGHISKQLNRAGHWLVSKSATAHLDAIIHWFKTRFMKQPLKYIIIGVLAPIFFAATLLHVVAEAALDMGGGAPNHFWSTLFDRLHWSYQAIDKALQVISKVVHLTTQQFVVAIQSLIELLEHMDFAFRQAPKMTDAIVNYFSSSATASTSSEGVKKTHRKSGSGDVPADNEDQSDDKRSQRAPDSASSPALG